MYNIIIGCTPYLASKDDNFLNVSGSFVLQELLDDVVTEGTSPNDGEVCVSGHEILCVVLRGIHASPSTIYPLSECESVQRHPSSYVMLTKPFR